MHRGRAGGVAATRRARRGLFILSLAVLALLLALPSFPTAAGRTPMAPGPRASPSSSCSNTPLSGGSCVETASSQGTGPVTWRNLSQGLKMSPPPASYGASAFDPALSQAVLFGGLSSGGQPLGGTWTFARGAWTAGPPSSTSGPAARWGATMVYDAQISSLVLLGGRNSTSTLSDAWIYGVAGWRPADFAGTPGPRAFAQAGYDPALSAVVIFGGEVINGGGAAQGLNDTWELHDGAWTQVHPVGDHAPPATSAGGMAFDASDGYLVLFGGMDPATGSSAYSSTWTFQGTSWSEILSPGGPAARIGPVLVADPAQGFLLLFGGIALAASSAAVPLADTWSFEAGAWSPRTPTLGAIPAARGGAAATFDPAGAAVLMFGGSPAPDGIPARVDTWSYGSVPLQLLVTVGPSAGPAPLNATFGVSISGGMAPYSSTWAFGDGSVDAAESNVTHSYDQVGNFTARLVVHDSAGLTATEAVPIDVLTPWQVAHQWTQLALPNDRAPSPRSSAQFAEDPTIGGLLLFGGTSASGVALGDTWEFVNDVWINLTSHLTTSPSPRSGGAMAYDPLDGYVVLFGGSDGSTPTGDTWTYSPTSGWTPLLSPSPSARALAHLVFDPIDGYLLLFGGGSETASGTWLVHNDTWAFRGGVWSNLTTSVGAPPPPTLGGAFVYDSGDSTVLLFGGSAFAPGGIPGTCYPDDGLWSYTDGQWHLGSASVAPSARLSASAAYDTADRDAVLFGGAENVNGFCSAVADTWTYSGGVWTDLTASLPMAPPARSGGAAAYDGSAGVVVLFGGNSAGTALNDTWVYPSPLNVSATTSTLNVSSPGGSTGNSSGGNQTGHGGSGPLPPGPFTVGYSVSGAGESAPALVTFVATASGGIGPFTFTWYFGDSSPTASGTAVSHEYAVAGDFEAVLTAVDGEGQTVVDLIGPLHVAPAVNGGGNAAPAVLSSTGPPGWWAFGLLGVATAGVLGLAIVVARREQRLREEGNELVREIEEL